MTANVSYVRFRPNGEIYGWGNAPSIDVPAGADVLIGNGESATHYVRDGAIVPFTGAQREAKASRPSPFHVWSNDTFAWTDTRTAQELAAEAVGIVKDKRLRLLVESDWTVVKSTELATPISAGWRAYRQALRDVTTQPGYPLDVVWPVPPAETTG